MAPFLGRGGFTAVPNELLALALCELTAEQFRLLLGLLFEAEFKDSGSTVTVAGRLVAIQAGEVLIGYDSLARRYAMSWQAVRRALRRLVDLRICSLRPAGQDLNKAQRPGTPPGTLPFGEAGTPTAARGGTPPQVARFRLAAGFQRPAPAAGTHSEGEPGTGGGTPPVSHPAASEEDQDQKLSLVAEGAGEGAKSGPADAVFDHWNEVCQPVGFAKARRTAQQVKAARARLREAGWLEAFRAACLHLAADPFYRGAGDRGWIADLGWLLKPGNAEKVADKAATRRALDSRPAAREVLS